MEHRIMEQIFIDSISNVRMVMGTIRMDAMNISGQTDDKQLKVEKRAEILMTPAAFNQVLRTLQEVEGRIKKQAEQQAKENQDLPAKGKKKK